MPKASPAYNAFNAGEWSPLLEGRQDLSKYFSALGRMRNFFPKVQGPAVRRPGTRFVAAVKDSATAVRLLPFEFNVEQAYIIEAGHQYFRFFRNNGQIVDGGSPVEIASPYAASDLPGLRFVQSADVLYLFHPDFMIRTLSRTSHIDWTLTAFDPQDGPYLATNTTDTTLTPSAASGSITVTASATAGINDDAGFLSTDVGRLIRLKNGGNWGYAKITAVNTTTTVDADVVNNFTNTTATKEWRLGLWSDTTGYPAVGTFFEDRLALGGVPAFPQRLDLSRTGDYENFTPTDADGTVVSDHALAFTLNANNVNAIRWLLDDEKALMVGTVGGEWPLRTATPGQALDAENPPQAKRATVFGSADVAPVKAGNAILFVQRAGRKLLEQAFFFEDDGFRSGDLTELAEHVTVGGVVEIAYQKEPDSVVWAVRADGVLLGMTYRREQEVVGWHQHVLGGQSDAAGAAAVVESVAVIPATDGSRDELWLVVQRRVDGQTVRHIEYMEAPLADDGDPRNAWYVDSGLTLNNPVNAVLTPGATTGAGVTFTAGSAAFVAEDVGRMIDYRFTTTDADGNLVHDTARAEIKSFVSGTEVTADIIFDFPDTNAIPAQQWHMSATQVLGLDHLEGETVQILADGASHPDKIVTGGQVALDRASSVVQVGLAYDQLSALQTLSIEAGAADGTAQGKTKRVTNCTIRFHRSLGAKAGPDLTTLDPLPDLLFRDPSVPMGKPAALFSGDSFMPWPGGYERDARITIVPQGPFPCTITGIFLQLLTQDR